MVHFSANDMRRWLILAAIVAGLSATGALMWRRAARPPTAAGPIVLISIDTLRADHLPIYGYGGLATTAIDGLAATSTEFDRAYSHAPPTLPAHTASLTRELPLHTGVPDNIGFTLKD